MTGSIHGDLLYRLLPEVYRERDADTPETALDEPHLKRWYGVHGALLDAVRGTLEQLYADHFPEGTEDRPSQDWIVPYLGALVDARPGSPFADGQREEVAKAVIWRKGKGTLAAIESIVEAVAQTEGEVHEGYRRVITSARPDAPLLPATSFGAEALHPVDIVRANDDAAASFAGINPQIAARHPGIDAATPDVRLWSRAVRSQAGFPGAEQGRFGGSLSIWPRDEGKLPPRPDSVEQPPVFWRQVNQNGAPCLPDSYQDVSRRTVDTRSPDPAGRIGRHHPQTVVIYLPTPQGLCPPDPKIFTWPLDFSDPEAEIHGYLERLEETSEDHLTITLRNITTGSVEIDGVIALDPPEGDERRTYRFERLRLNTSVPLGPHDLAFRRCAVKTIDAAPAGADTPRLALRDCLVDVITGGPGIAELEYVTVLTRIDADIMINASEVLFPDDVGGDRLACVRYSRLAAPLLADGAVPEHGKTNSATAPAFFSNTFCTPGAGVLRPETPAAILGGAEDGGEMGAFHAWAHEALRDALTRKLADYLPFGAVPVLTYDATLKCPPPTLIETP